MHRLIPLAAFALLLAACQSAPEPAAAPGTTLPEAADPRLPAAVLAALPDDVSPTEIRQQDGCWVYDLSGLTIPLTRDGRSRLHLRTFAMLRSVAICALLALAACGAEFEEDFPSLAEDAPDDFTGRLLDLQTACYRGQALQRDDGVADPAALAPQVYEACRKDTDLILERQSAALPQAQRAQFTADSRARDLARIEGLIRTARSN